MLTRTGHSESLPHGRQGSRQGSPEGSSQGSSQGSPQEDSFIASIGGPHDRFSLQPRHAPSGAVTLVLIVSCAVMVPIAEHFASRGTVLSRVLSIVVLVLAPSILSGLYSLFFERSKVYGSLDLLLAGIVLAKQPSTWYWLKVYLPFACAFTVFCVVVLVLERRGRR
jgi:hypothetical protein